MLKVRHCQLAQAPIDGLAEAQAGVVGLGDGAPAAVDAEERQHVVVIPHGFQIKQQRFVSQPAKRGGGEQRALHTVRRLVAKRHARRAAGGAVRLQIVGQLVEEGLNPGRALQAPEQGAFVRIEIFEGHGFPTAYNEKVTTHALVALLWFALAPAPAPDRWPIEELAVSGNSRYPADRILAASGLKKGDVVGKQDLEAAQKRLMDSGAFSGVGFSYGPAASKKGYRVQFEVIEAPFVYPFRFERLDAPEAELIEVLKRSDPLFADRIPATQPALNRYVRAIEAHLASKGKAEPVSATVAAGESGELMVVFSPAAPPPAVAEVRFRGNTAIPEAKLQSVIAAVAIGIPYTEKRFRELLEANIRPLYEALGRIRVSFPTLTAEQAQDVKGVVVTVEVSEGEIYQLGAVRFQAQGFPEEQLAAAAGLKSGEAADFSAVGAGLDRLRRRLARSGYLKPEVEVERNISDAERKVDLIVRVRPGPQYTFGKLSIQGLDLIGEAEVRRLWALKTGAPFDAEYPDYFLQRVREDGVFDNLGKTRAEAQVNEANLTVDVTLHFR